MVPSAITPDAAGRVFLGNSKAAAKPLRETFLHLSSRWTDA
jgi:hypothetical protein